MASIVNIRFDGDASGLMGALGSVGSAIGTMQDKLNQMGDSLTNAGQRLTSSVTMPLVNFGIDLFQVAANTEAMVGKVETVLGDAADALLDFSTVSADSFGISRRQALEWGATYGDIFKQAGVAPEVLSDTSVGFLQLASDAQAFTDLPMEEVLLALSSGLRGEQEPLKRLGLAFTDNEVRARAVTMGLAETTSEVDEQSKVLARHSLIMEKGARFQGQFAREAEGASGQMAIATAKFDDAKAMLGEKLLPIGTKILNVFSSLVDKFTALDASTQKIILVVGALVAAVGPLLIGLGFIIKALAFLMSPVVLVVAAIAALAAGIWWLYNNNERFRNGVEKVWTWIQENVIPTAKEVGKALLEGFGRAVEWVQANWPRLQAAIADVIGFLQTEVIPRVQSFTQKVTDVLGRVVTWVQTTWPKLQEAITHVFNAIMVVAGPILAAFLAMVQMVLGWVQSAWELWGDNFITIVTTVWDYIYSIIETAVNLVRNAIELVLNIINGDWGEAWQNIVNIVTGVWNFIIGMISTAVTIVSQVIGGALEGIWNITWSIWSAISDFISGVWNGITGFVSDGIEKVVGFFQGLPGRISSFVSGAFDGFKDAFANAINWVIQRWNNFRLGPWDLPSIDTPMGTIGGQRIQFDTPNIPYLAKGGNILRGGSAVVGDAGPELLELPRGARVSPLGRSGGAPIVINVHGSVVTERELVGFVRDELSKTSRRNVGVGFV